MTLIIRLIRDSGTTRLDENVAKISPEENKRIYGADKVASKQRTRSKAELNTATDDTGHPTQD